MATLSLPKIKVRSSNRFQRILFIGALVLGFVPLIFGQDLNSIYLGYEEIYKMQQDPQQLEAAQRELSRTLANAPELMGSSQVVDQLGERIAYKRKMLTHFSLDHSLVFSVITESATALIHTLRGISEPQISGFDQLLPLMDFIQDYWNELMHAFRFPLFQEFLSIVKIPGLAQKLSIRDEDFRFLAETILNTYNQNPSSFSSQLLFQIAHFGGEPLLRYFALLLYPDVLTGKEVEYFDAHRKLQLYVDIGRHLYGPELSERIHPDLWSLYQDLDRYFLLKDRMDILHRRIISADLSNIIAMIPQMMEHLNELERVSIPSHRLQQTAQSILGTCITRLQVEGNSLQGIIIPQATLDLLSSIQLKNPQTQRLVEQLHQPVLGIAKNNRIPLDSDRSVSDIESETFARFRLIIIVSCALGLLVGTLLLLFKPMLRARFFRKLGLRSFAIAIVKQLSFEKPLDPDLHVMLAQMLVENDQTEEANAEFRAASRLLERSSNKKKKPITRGLRKK